MKYDKGLGAECKRAGINVEKLMRLTGLSRTTLHRWFNSENKRKILSVLISGAVNQGLMSKEEVIEYIIVIKEEQEKRLDNIIVDNCGRNKHWVNVYESVLSYMNRIK